MCFVAIARLRRTFVQVRIPPPAEQNLTKARAVIVDLGSNTESQRGTEKFPQSSNVFSLVFGYSTWRSLPQKRTPCIAAMRGAVCDSNRLIFTF